MAPAAPSKTASRRTWIPAAVVAAVIATVALWLFLVLHTPEPAPRQAARAVDAPTPAQPTASPAQNRPAPRSVPASLAIPAVMPGDTCVMAQAIYGSYMEQYDIGGGGWNLTNYSVSILPDQDKLKPPTEKCIIESVLVTGGGTPTQGPEGMVLGVNTLADVERKFGSRVIAESKCVMSTDTQWTASISVKPDAQHRFRVQYSVGLTPETENGFPAEPNFGYFEGKTLKQFELENPNSPLETGGCYVPSKTPAAKPKKP